MMRCKLGLFKEERKDKSLISNFLLWMYKNSADYNNTFYSLITTQRSEKIFSNNSELQIWYNCWRQRLERDGNSISKSNKLMKIYNPQVIPRNNQVEDVLKAVEKFNDYKPLKNFLKILSYPYKNKKIPLKYLKPDTNKLHKTFCGT